MYLPVSAVNKALSVIRDNKKYDRNLNQVSSAIIAALLTKFLSGDKSKVIDYSQFLPYPELFKTSDKLTVKTAKTFSKLHKSGIIPIKVLCACGDFLKEIKLLSSGRYRKPESKD